MQKVHLQPAHVLLCLQCHPDANLSYVESRRCNAEMAGSGQTTWVSLRFCRGQKGAKQAYTRRTFSVKCQFDGTCPL